MNKPHVEIPEQFLLELQKNPVAEGIFMKFPPSHKREVLGYIYEAKKPETILKRIQKTIEKLNDGWE